MLPSLMTFGARMRKLREARGLTRRDVEDISGVSQRQQAYLENDTKDPKRATLEALAKALGPEIVQAAFPKLTIVADSAESPTARKVSLREWVNSEESSVLGFAGVGR
jgi:transcriptional regulator with XRE-family HTH domain